MPSLIDPPSDPASRSRNRSRIAGLILAAGASSRMGRPKLLIKHDGVSLIRRTAEAALGANLDPVFVVLGGYAEQLSTELVGLPVHRVFNKDWAGGMGTSIRAGAQAVQTVGADAVVILTADQPYVTAAVIGRLVAAFVATGKSIIASNYGDGYGVPTLFDATYFSRLQSLTGDRGAKALIESAGDPIETIAFPEGAYDVDSPEDLAPR